MGKIFKLETLFYIEMKNFYEKLRSNLAYRLLFLVVALFFASKLVLIYNNVKFH